MTALSKLTAARTSLVLEQPFFGTLALSLTLTEDSTCKTAWTDGRSLGYNPQFVESLPHSQLTALFAHEVMHCAMGHPWRREGREFENFNIACDLAINSDLAHSFTLPDGALMPSEKDAGKSAEWYYSQIQSKQPDNPQPGKHGQPGTGNGPAVPNPQGEVRDAPTGPDSDGEPAPTEQEWKQKAAHSLQAAKMAGTMPGGMARAIDKALQTKIDIRSLLLRFFSERATADYSWTRPNSRYIASGLYLPALHSVELGEIAIAIDTSASVNAASLQYAKGILESIIEECSPLAVTVRYFDTKVQALDRFAKGDPLTWQPKGGGGTSFIPVLEEIDSDGQAVCIIVITDLEGSFPAVPPSMPVLWLSTEEHTAPFGETVYLDR